MTLIAIFVAGLIAGLLIGPDSEREFAARVDGWLSGHAQGIEARRAATECGAKRESPVAESDAPK